MMVGVVTGLWLLSGPRQVGSVTFDVHTLLFSATAVCVGFQAVLFAAFTKIFAISEGLFPKDPNWDKLYRIFTLEKGLLLGAILTTIGVGGSLYAFSDWGLQSFGSLDPTRTLRIVIPAVLSLTLGCQIVLSSFFLSMLGMSRR
jgi:hypothetical protein